MGTGVTPKRIATGNIWLSIILGNSTMDTFLYFFFLRKEVIQPHLPIRLPCYDFTPVIGPAFGTVADLDAIADAVGAKFERNFVLFNGEKI